MDAGLVFTRDKLASFLNQRFKELHEDKEENAGTYLVRQTRSESIVDYKAKSSIDKARSFLIYAVVAVLLVAISVGLAFFYFSQPVADSRSEEHSHDELMTSVDESQSIGVADITPQRALKYGRLKVVVEPWGEVFVDGKRLGLTPFSPRKISEGEHNIRITNSLLAKEKKIRVVIKADQDTLVRHQF